MLDGGAHIDHEQPWGAAAGGQVASGILGSPGEVIDGQSDL